MKSLCIFCGSSPGALPEYHDAARLMGTELARRNITMVYGGGNVGLMGIAADAALAAGGRVIGVIPEALVKKEVAHQGLTELRVVGSMHERTLQMSELSDAFVALPGGIGTAEELLEAFTWTQLGLHPKPCGILNIQNYYEGLMLQLGRMVRDRFLLEDQMWQLIVEDDVDRMLTQLATAEVQLIDKWIDKSTI